MKIVELFKEFKKEELFFGFLAVATILMNESTGAPGMVCSLLLAFYYIVFSWYIFPVGEEKNFMFSNLTGIIYAICLVCIAIYSVKIYDGYFFFYLEGGLLFLLTLYLINKKEWQMYRKLHFVRIVAIFFMNICLYFFRFT